MGTQSLVGKEESVAKNNLMEKSISWLETRLKCSKVEAANIYHEVPNLQNGDTLKNAERNIELLTQNNVSVQAITSNPFLLACSNGKHYMIYQKEYSFMFITINSISFL